MEQIVYSNVQAKSCSGSCTYSCGSSGFQLLSNDCSVGCNCSTGSDWIDGCNGGDCVLGYEDGCSVGCV